MSFPVRLDLSIIVVFLTLMIAMAFLVSATPNRHRRMLFFLSCLLLIFGAITAVAFYHLLYRLIWF